MSATKPTTKIVSKNLLADYELEPYYQGELSRACSIYAAINLVRVALVTADVREIDDQLDAEPLYRAATKALHDKGSLYPMMVKDGIDVTSWKLVVQTVLDALPAGLRSVIDIKWLNGKTSEGDLRQAITDGLPVALKTVCDEENHYTVICGFDKGGFQLLDSDDNEVLKTHRGSEDQVYIAANSAVVIAAKELLKAA